MKCRTLGLVLVVGCSAQWPKDPDAQVTAAAKRDLQCAHVSVREKYEICDPGAEPDNDHCQDRDAFGCGKVATYSISRHGVRIIHIVEMAPDRSTE